MAVLWHASGKAFDIDSLNHAVCTCHFAASFYSLLTKVLLYLELQVWAVLVFSSLVMARKQTVSAISFQH